MSNNTFNFSAGPAMLPVEVMRKAAGEFTNWHDSGMSIMEMSHRSADFMGVLHKMEADLREVMLIPDNYKILITHGGASLQFSAIPMNLVQQGDTVDYFDTGVWSNKAIKEASRYAKVNVVTGGNSANPTEIADSSTWKFSPDAKYIHICSNETITGLEFKDKELEVVFAQGKPVIADMSSSIMCREIDVSQYAMIYAGAQKNIGPAGFAIVIVREDLLGHARETTPSLLNWEIYANNESMFNTPATFSWYLAGLVFQWIKACGGVAEIARVNELKARKLYAYIDQSTLYTNSIVKQNRSWMNVTFNLTTPELEKAFLVESKAAGLLSLKGHKAFGGMRASIYNAMPEEGVDALIQFMDLFAKKHA